MAAVVVVVAAAAAAAKKYKARTLGLYSYFLDSLSLVSPLRAAVAIMTANIRWARDIVVQVSFFLQRIGEYVFEYGLTKTPV